MGTRAIRFSIAIGAIVTGLVIAGCTRSRSTDVVPTSAPGNVDVTMQAVLSGTQTAQAIIEAGAGGGGELTPTPIVLPTEVITQTATPAPTATLVPTATPAQTSYTVKSGDWLYKIARDHNVSVEALIAANPGISPNNIQPGQVFVIPAPGAPAPAGAVVSGPTTYVVQPGEWIYQIARKLGKDPKAIIAANPGIDPNHVNPGQVLNIP